MEKEQLFSKTLKHDFKIAKYVIAGGVALVGTLGLYTALVPDIEFLNKELVTLEGKVVDERYVPPTLGKERSYSSQYFFSIDDTIGRRVGIQVINSTNPPLSLEYV